MKSSVCVCVCVGTGVSVCNLPKPLDLSLQSDSKGTQGLRPSLCRDLLHTHMQYAHTYRPVCVHIDIYLQKAKVTHTYKETHTRRADRRASLQAHR